MNIVSSILLFISLACLWLVVMIHIYSPNAHGEEDIPAWQKAQEAAIPNFQCLLFMMGTLTK